MIGGMSKRNSLRWNDGQDDDWDGAVREVVEKEMELLRPAVRADRQMVVGLLHEQFREFGASGRMWNQAEIAASLAAETGDVAAEAEDLQAVRLADDVVLLTYRARRPDRVSLRSSLWVCSPAGWQLFFHQGTICA
jgi:ribonuclease HI